MGEYANFLNSGIFLFQVCSIKIESFAYDKENLLFKWHSPGVEFANVIEIPQLKLEGIKGSSAIDVDISSAILKLHKRAPDISILFYCRRLYIFSMLSEISISISISARRTPYL